MITWFSIIHVYKDPVYRFVIMVQSPRHWLLIIIITRYLHIVSFFGVRTIPMNTRILWIVRVKSRRRNPIGSFSISIWRNATNLIYVLAIVWRLPIDLIVVRPWTIKSRHRHWSWWIHRHRWRLNPTTWLLAKVSGWWSPANSQYKSPAATWWNRRPRQR